MQKKNQKNFFNRLSLSLYRKQQLNNIFYNKEFFNNNFYECSLFPISAFALLFYTIFYTKIGAKGSKSVGERLQNCERWKAHFVLALTPI